MPSVIPSGAERNFCRVRGSGLGARGSCRLQSRLVWRTTRNGRRQVVAGRRVGRRLTGSGLAGGSRVVCGHIG